MIKKIVIIISIAVIFIAGCNRGIVGGNKIPFLTFKVDEERDEVFAYLNYWDFEKGKIVQTNEIIYTTKVTDFARRTYKNGKVAWDFIVQYLAYPLSWDGESYMYLSSVYHKVNEPLNFKIRLFDDRRGIPLKKGEILPVVYRYSKDLQVSCVCKRYWEEPFTTFTFTIFKNDEATTKSIDISLFNDMFHGGIPMGQAYLYDKDKNRVKSLHLYFDKEKGGHFVVCTINMDDGKYKWNEIKGIKGCIPYMGNMDIGLIGEKLYVPQCDGGIGLIDLRDYSYKSFLNHEDIVKIFSNFKNSDVPISHASIDGEYKNYLIFHVLYNFEQDNPTNFEYFYILIDTDTKEVKGILQFNPKDKNWINIMDKDGNRLSKISVDKLIKGLSKIHYISGNLLDYGRFLDSHFIRFPHKNGN